MLKKLIAVFLLTIPSLAFSDYAFYYGEINRIWANDNNGGFIVTYTAPSSLSDCKHYYAIFNSSEIQPEQLKNSYSLALAALMGGKTVGIVIDKSINGVDGYCYAKSIDITK